MKCSNRVAVGITARFTGPGSPCPFVWPPARQCCDSLCLCLPSHLRPCQLNLPQMPSNLKVMIIWGVTIMTRGQRPTTDTVMQEGTELSE